MSADQIAEIAKQGLLGLLLVVSVGVIAYLYKQLSDSIAARLSDWKEIAETVKANSVVMRDWIAANESRTRAIEANARTQELAAASLNTLVSELGKLSTTINERTGEALKSNREMREALIQKGVSL